jgi:hypothetical protein
MIGMEIKTRITLGMVGAMTVASVGAGYGLRVFSPPSTLTIGMTALSSNASLSTVSFNTISGKAIEITPPVHIKVTQDSTVVRRVGQSTVL